MSFPLLALLCFAVAAVAGLANALKIFGDQAPLWPVTIVHGLFGASGLVLLLLAVLQGASMAATYALCALVVAALGGFFLVSFHLRGKPHPKPVVLIHAGVAVLGVATLLTLFL